MAPHVVIVGGGFGGLEAARVLATADTEVTLVDRRNYHLFQPLLYQVATAALSPADIASPIRWVLRRYSNVRVLLAEARAVDAAHRRLLLDQHDLVEPQQGDRPPGGAITALDYDYLILATGVSHAYFGHPQWSERAPGLKTLDDALEIRRQVLLAFEAAERTTDPVEQRRLLTFVIVGGGPTGVELAGALAEIARRTLSLDFRSIRPESAHVLLLEASPHLLGAFPPVLRERATNSLQTLGVDVRTGVVVTEVDREGVKVGEERIAAQTVLWAAGVAASGLAATLAAPLDRTGRVLVEPTLSVPGHPEIFVVGDLCALVQDGQQVPGVAQAAKQEGAHAARSILRMVRGQAPDRFRYRDYGSMATIGRGSAVAVIGPLKTSGLFAWFLWLFVHIFWLIGFRNRLAVVVEWAWSYLTFQRRMRLITGGRLRPPPSGRVRSGAGYSTD